MNANDQENDDDQREPPFSHFVTAAAIIVLICVMYGASTWRGFGTDWEKSAPFGDTFGALNTVFSGLAFAGVLYAILVQRYDIKIAKKDARRTKTMMEKQEEQLSLQNKATQKQMFENTFFKLADSIPEVVELTTLTDATTNKAGLQAIAEAYQDIIRNPSNVIPKEYKYDSHTRTLTIKYHYRHQENRIFTREIFFPLLDLLKDIIYFIEYNSTEHQSIYYNILKSRIRKTAANLLLLTAAHADNDRYIHILFDTNVIQLISDYAIFREAHKKLLDNHLERIKAHVEQQDRY